MIQTEAVQAVGRLGTRLVIVVVGMAGQVVSESDSHSMVVGSILIKVNFVTKSEESHHFSVIPGKMQKESRGVVTSRGRTGVALLRLASGLHVLSTETRTLRRQPVCVPN